MSSNDETDHERLERIQKSWCRHDPTSETDLEWLLHMSIRAIKAEAALPKGVTAIFFEVPRTDLEQSARSLSLAVARADTHAARHGFDQPHPNDLPVGMPIDPASPTGDHTPLLTLGDLRQADQTASAAATEIRALRDALEFYADPDTYAGIWFLPDRPCGDDFIDDFDDTLDPGYPRPGKRARAALEVPTAHPIVYASIDRAVVERDAARWRFTERPDYFHVIDTEFDTERPYSVGIKRPDESLTNSVLVRGHRTLGEAIDAAIAREGIGFAIGPAAAPVVDVDEAPDLGIFSVIDKRVSEDLADTPHVPRWDDLEWCRVTYPHLDWTVSGDPSVPVYWDAGLGYVRPSRHHPDNMGIDVEPLPGQDQSDYRARYRHAKSAYMSSLGEISQLEHRIKELEAERAPEKIGDAQDAARFQALMRCGCIKMQGSAGVDPVTGARRYPGTPGQVHFGAEFWPEGEAETDMSTRWGRYALAALADDILALEAAARGE